jgi:hypothetical protein
VAVQTGEEPNPSRVLTGREEKNSVAIAFNESPRWIRTPSTFTDPRRSGSAPRKEPEPEGTNVDAAQ